MARTLKASTPIEIFNDEGIEKYLRSGILRHRADLRPGAGACIP
jgi:hypothetical protein